MLATTTPKTTLGTIEIGRFIAALVVVFDHSLLNTRMQSAHPQAPILAHLMVPAALAVQYFFVISGFVMFTAHHKDFGQWTAPLKFWWRRAARIYPLYWLAMAIMLIYLWRVMTPTYTWQLLSLYPGPSPEMIPAAWSLRFEIGFYVMFGLMLLPKIGRPLLALWVLATIWQAAVGFPPAAMPTIAYFVSPYGFYFFAGLLGGWVFSCPCLRLRTVCLLCAFGLALLLLQMPAIGWGNDYGPPLTRALTGLAIAALITAGATLERLNLIRLGPTARLLGAISYPLYILHRSLAQLAGMNDPHLKLPNPALYALLFLFIAAQIAVCLAITFGIDRPLQRWLRRMAPLSPAQRPG